MTSQQMSMQAEPTHLAERASTAEPRQKLKIVLFANTDWYLYNFRRSMAMALVESGHDVLLLSPPGQYAEKLRALGLRWKPVPMDRRSLNPLRELILLNWLRNLLIRERVDLIHNFTIKCVIYGSLAARLSQWNNKQIKTGRINAVAGMGYVFTSTELKAWILKPLVKALLRFALGGDDARLILQNPDDVALLNAALIIEPQRIRLIQGSGADCVRFSPATKPRNDGSFKVLLPARLLWDKGIKEYVEAARTLREQRPEIQFLLAGEPDKGNPASVPLETVHDWVKSGAIEWLGHVDEMPLLFRKVDTVVLPSYREGLPKGLIEAGASGIALVTTDVPGCREVVTDGIDGLLVPPRNSQAIANAVLTLYNDPILRNRLAAAARAKALSHFDEKLVIKKTLDVYQELR
jgi:glycosyltransferase involved in cell wall biosynthesis